MPHGGGHHGGGFSGGGGFHHHHHRHHGFHHHHHHSNYGGVMFMGGYRHRRSRLSCILVFVLTVVVVGAFVGLGLGIHGTYGSDDNYFSPGDSRLYAYSQFFCLGGDVVYRSRSVIPDNASLYLLSSKPTLRHTNSFDINTTRSISSYSYQYWYFYLYPDSKLTVTGCTENSRHYDLLLIKSKGSFNSWRSHPSSQHTIESTEVRVPCPKLNDPSATLTHTVDEEESYYIVVDNNYSPSVQATISLHISRTGYTADGLDSQPNCTGSTGCSIYAEAANDNINFALVTTAPPSDSNWDKNIEVYYDCIPNVVSYVLVTVVPFVAIVCLCVTAVVIIVIFVVIKKKTKKEHSQPLLQAPQPTASEPLKLSSAPPPPSYDSTATTDLRSASGAAPPPYAP